MLNSSEISALRWKIVLGRVLVELFDTPAAVCGTLIAVVLACGLIDCLAPDALTLPHAVPAALLITLGGTVIALGLASRNWPLLRKLANFEYHSQLDAVLGCWVALLIVGCLTLLPCDILREYIELKYWGALGFLAACWFGLKFLAAIPRRRLIRQVLATGLRPW